MTPPKFLMADNTEFPEDVYVIHTEYPRFILHVDSEEMDWMDELDDSSEAEMAELVKELLEKALAFFKTELEIYDSLEED